MKEHVSYQGPAKVLICPLCFTFPLISSPLNDIFMAGCISWFIKINHAEEEAYRAGRMQLSPPFFAPRASLFACTLVPF